MSEGDRQFHLRASHIPFHGIGLSVDVYSPHLLDLVQELNGHRLPFGYLEIFKAPVSALHTVRAQVKCPFFEYHADGLWVTQPDLWNAYPIQAELEQVNSHLRALGCYWINQECATKQMAGYSLGTYLPPLLTRVSAQVTASNARSIQDQLDASDGVDRSVAPLFLLETPPLTYFACGDLSYMEFFRIVTSHSACGLVLDIGHLWTVYRYAGYAQSQSVTEFVEMFLSEFPLDRVVQIHIAGLNVHPRISRLQGEAAGLPAWIDAHDAPVPDVLFAMLEQILSRCELTALKGVALEVDTKPIPLILQDYAMLRGKLAGWEGDVKSHQPEDREKNLDRDSPEECVRFDADAARGLLCQAHSDYVRGLTHGSVEPFLQPYSCRVTDPNGLRTYSHFYLPFEIFEWGGDLRVMFPMTCTAMERDKIDLSRFLSFWFQQPRPNIHTFDYFLLKVQRFVDFVQSESPNAVPTAEKEAEALRDAYDIANQL